jgi:hypothetical protein
MWHDVVVIWQLMDDVAVGNWWMMCVGNHKMHIFTANIPTFDARYRR